MKLFSTCFVLRLSLLGLLFLFPALLFAQSDGVLIDYAPTPPVRDNSAVMELRSANQGFLAPKVVLTATNVAAPISTPTNGLMVYNTNATGSGPTDVQPGYYFWSGTGWTRFMNGNSSVISGSGAATRVAFWDGANSLSSNVNLYWDNSSSRLGIGTASPGSELHIGTTGWNANQLHFSSGWGVAGYHATIGSGYAGITSAGIMLGSPHLPYRSGYGAKMRYASDQAASFYWDLGINAEAGGLNDRFDLNRNNVNLMSVLNNGNVGVGTTGPAQKLEVNGNILNQGKLYQNTIAGQGSGAHGISWYSPTYVTWYDYMAPAGGTNAPNGTAAPTDATSGVTSWARRFNIENVGSYGWLFESGPNNATAPTVKFAISSATGNFHTIGNGYIDGTIRVSGGGPAAGRVLTSDATGNGTWTDATTLVTYANLSGIPIRTNWVGVHRNFVAEQLSWKNYGNSHTIFDASAGTSPQGNAISNTNPDVAWAASYPTLMGWNGANTYGVRVDMARYAETAGSAPGDNLGNHIATSGIKRNAHSTGFLEGSYNNVGANSTFSNPIYTIGSAYNPSDAALGNMYGIGYSHSNFWGTGGGKPGGWGMYASSAGTIRIVLSAEEGIGWASASFRAPLFYDTDNTGFYLDPNATTVLNEVGWGNSATRTQDKADAGAIGSAKSGFYQTSAPSPASSWYPGASSWQHLLEVRHSNPANNYSMQIAGGFYDQDFWVRKTNDNASTAWSKMMTSNTVFTTFIQWGRTDCPSSSSVSIIYSGYAASGRYDHSGSGANTLCLSPSPDWTGSSTSTGNDNGGLIYGTEFQGSGYGVATYGVYSSAQMQDYDGRCATCLVSGNTATMMVPGTVACPAGWALQYWGYLMSSHYTQTKSEFVCVANNPTRDGSAADSNGNLWYPVEAELGSLTAPYQQDREIVCSVCTR